MTELVLNRFQYLELEKIGLGAFLPLDRFMTEEDVNAVADTMRLPSGEVFPLPVVLDLTLEEATRLKGLPRVSLVFEGLEVGTLMPESIYRPDKVKLALKVFGTAKEAHPGVSHLNSMGDWFVGGPVEFLKRVKLDFSKYELSPQETREAFAERGWKSIIGFQTRNVPHRAHEYLQRVGLETSDGLFIQPLVGRKKLGDYTPEAVITGYKALIEGFFPANRVLMGILSTSMRYAGPREAVFHAIIRKNYGCTRFIVGRDHAGVGNYYGKYDAHELTRQFGTELGIEVVRLNGPFYCRLCDGIATEQTCQHFHESPENIREISGTDMRAMLVEGRKPEPHIMRPEVIEALRGEELFITEPDS
jgi:sulfate adenylyltransferase